MIAYAILTALTVISCTATISLKPQRLCVPTDVVAGPCHECVCAADGMFHCRTLVCSQKSDKNGSKPMKMECGPYLMYRENALICTCSLYGYWLSNNCRDTFQHLKSRNTSLRSKVIKSNKTCTPLSLYLIDCNICRCNKEGHFGKHLCTNRICDSNHKKIESCSFGDIIRTEDEVCSCSDINLYIDRLCIKINNESVQVLNTSALETILAVSKQVTRSHDAYSKKCTPHSVIKINCNRCVCTNGRVLACTDKICIGPEKEKKRDTDSLPALKSENDECIPGKQYRWKCNTCMSNTSTSKNVELPEIKDGEKCVAGKVYRMDCNTCKCGLDNTLLCTKMACLREDIINMIKMQHPAEEVGTDSERKSKYSFFPSLETGECVPGRIYVKNCYLCFCDDNKVAQCGSKDTCSGTTQPFHTLEPSDIRTELTQPEIAVLRSLPNAASRCQPGQTYKVDCNICLCKADHNLFCSKMLCLSLDDMNRVNADKKSGIPCVASDDIEKSPCIRCACLRGLSKCFPEPGCQLAGRRLHGLSPKYKPRFTLSVNTDEKCVPSAIYKDNCNKCYCQPEGTLRCTQKTCLNYVQSLKLKKHRLFLEKNGL